MPFEFSLNWRFRCWFLFHCYTDP